MIPWNLSLDEGKILVNIARIAIETWLKDHKRIKPPNKIKTKLQSKMGVFTTLKYWGKDKSLRGCIGLPYPIKPLVEAVIESSIDAATSDPRFPPITLEELESIVIEISILTPPKEIKVNLPLDFPNHIQIGIDGLIVEKDRFKGLLLPQVAIEWDMNPEEFLSNCCMKAGLPPDAWLSTDIKINKFQAIIFAEEKPKANIHQVEKHQGF